MSTVFYCLECSKEFETASGLRKHLTNYPGHKQEASSKPFPAPAAARDFVNVAPHHRTARLKELLKLLTPEECLSLLLPQVAKFVPTSSFLFKKCWSAGKTLSEGKLGSELEVLMKTLAENYPVEFVYSLKQPSVSALFSPSNKCCITKNYTTVTKVGQKNCKDWVKFIDDLAAPTCTNKSTVSELCTGLNLQEVNFTQKEKAELCEFVLSYNNGEFFKHLLMPLVFKQNFRKFVQFAAGLVSNFNIGHNKYQNVVRNQLGKELEAILGVNIMVAKDDMTEELKEQKESLQESLSLKFNEYNGVIAAYTDVKKTIEWLLSKETLQNTILVPNGKLILYHYIDAFPWMQWSKFFNGETAIRLKLVEPHNLLSSIVTVCSWLGPDDYQHASNLGKETIKQLSELKTVYHPLLGEHVEIVVRAVADGCQRRSITGSSSASSTYPIPEAPEHQKQLGDMTITQQFCHEWASVENREKKGCHYSSDIKAMKRENTELPPLYFYLFQVTDTSEEAESSVCDPFPRPVYCPKPHKESTLNKISTLKEGFLLTAKSGFHSASAVELTIETATKFASTANHGAANNSAHLNSFTSTPQGVNVKRSDARVSHELFTLKVNTSKPQQPGMFVIEHQKEKSAVLRKKVVIPFTSVLGLELDESKITLDTSEQPQTFYKRKDESGGNSTWSEHFVNPAGGLSVASEKTRVEIQLQQPSEILSSFIHSDIHLKKAVNGGIRETYAKSSQEMLEPDAFFPVARDATTVRAAQLAVLELLKQPEGTSDVTWLIKMFDGIQQQFKKSLRHRMSGVPVGLVEKEE